MSAAAAALNAEDCVFRSHPFRELEDARAYMRPTDDVGGFGVLEGAVAVARHEKLLS